MSIMLQVSALTSEDTAADSKPQRLNRGDIIVLTLDPDSDGDISDCDWCVWWLAYYDKEQPASLHQRVYKWGWKMKQTERGAWDYTKDESFESGADTSHTSSGTSAWRK